MNTVPCEQTPLRAHIATDASACSSTTAASDISHNTTGASTADSSDGSTMDDTRRVVIKICIDFAVLVFVAFPILAFFLWGAPYERGFFCDDESLMHPFHESTVRNWMLYIIGLVLPIGLITITELIKVYASKSSASYARLQLGNWSVPRWVTNTYKHVGFFAFGAAVSQLTTDIGKYSIGRLRPHFFSVCQPIMPDGSTCADAVNIGRYIEQFRCAGTGSSDRMLKEMRLSFPSGHSSFATYTMVYTAIYLHSRMTWRGSRLLKNFLQFLLILLAWWTAMTRISDYKHHWSDVLAGATLGTFVALIVSSFVSDLFVRRDRSLIPQTRYELGSANGNGN